MIRTHKRQAFTLLEVLISTSVIMVGVFGIAGAIALSEQVVKQAFRSDMVANGGRAALRTLLSSDFVKEKSGSSVVFEAPDTDDCDIGKDHLKATSLREEDTPPNYDTSLNGDYTWVRTYSKVYTSSQAVSGYCEVSAAVAYKAATKGNSPITASVTVVSSDAGESDAMNISVPYSDSMEYIVTGEYIFLYNSNEGHWYHIESLTSDENRLYLTVAGPQFQNGTPSNLKTTGGIKGVYSQIVPTEYK